MFAFIVKKNMAQAAWMRTGCNVQSVGDGLTMDAPAGVSKNYMIFNVAGVNLYQG